MKKTTKTAKTRSAEEQRLDALLKEKSDAYVAGIEDNDSGVNFDRLPADLLLVVEAFNDWSAGALGEDMDVRFTFSGTDPTCATEHELEDLLGRLHGTRTVLYPVTGFLLSTEDERLKYRPMDASYRIRPHTDGLRTSAVRVAESKHVSDVDAAHQLWVFCATEDCYAYLEHQMAIHSMQLEEEEVIAAKRLISSYIQDRFSAGQIWNAMWRSVRRAAALSNRQYFNNAKAAKQVPKYIDQALDTALADPLFNPYDRMLSTPVGAVLTLFRQRFGVDDTTPGARVREILQADAVLAPTDQESDEPEEDDADGSDYVGDPALAQGTFYFAEEFTELDRLALACFGGIKLNPEFPNWDEAGQIGRIDFTLSELYSFNGAPFYAGVLEMLSAEAPSEEAVSRRAAEKPANNWARETAYTELATEGLVMAGVSEDAAYRISQARIYPIEPEEIVAMVRGVPLPSGLVAMRFDYASVGDYSVKKDDIAVGGYTFAVPELLFEPVGNDMAMVKAYVDEDMDELAAILANAVSRGLRSTSKMEHSALLARIGRKLVSMAEHPGMGAENTVNSEPTAFDSGLT